MKFTLSWLKEHLDTKASVDEIAEALTRIGLEVEGIEDKSKSLAPFTVAYVKSAEQHPNADKLRVCIVDTGKEVVQVVCGAPNARTGMKGVFAPSGTTIPGTGLHLKPTNIRGVASNGMLVSEREMGLSNEHDGIIDLPADAPIGAPFAEIMGLADPVLELKLTPNRGDCASVYGIARDLAAAGLGTLKTGTVEPIPGKFESPLRPEIDLPKGKDHYCQLFWGRLIRGVKNRPSPDWLQRRLKAIGLRPISALVDITNFITFDRGRPLHVYDADKVKGNLIARLAKPGETVLALNGKTYTLDDDMCVIADERGVHDIGGIMGGEETGCTDTTTNVFVEAAYFDPVSIARTGRRLEITSDARYRFERGIDPEFVRPGVELATRMILDICGGEPSQTIAAGKTPEWRRTVAFDPMRVASLTGLEVSKTDVVTTLQKLGFSVEAKDARMSVMPPSWRPDVQGPADLVEEVVRIAGLDKLPSTPLPRLSAVTKPVLTPSQRRTRDAKRMLAARGFVETVNDSFVPRAHAKLFGGGQDELQIANPISAELDAMRPSVLPSLLAAAARNQARGFNDTLFFEVGPQFTGGAPGEQLVVATGIRKGQGPRHWSGKSASPDVFAAKADAIALLEALGAPTTTVQITSDAPAWYHPGRSGVVRLGPKNLMAVFGEIHPKILKALDVEGPVAAFEVVLDSIPSPKQKPTKEKPPLTLADYPAVERDFAFIVDVKVTAAEIVKAAQGVDRALIESVSVFDVYEGKGIDAGKKSIAIAVRLQPKDKTMTEDDIKSISDRIIAAVTKASGATLRG